MARVTSLKEPRVPAQNADTAKQLTVTQQSQEEVARVKEQLEFQVEQVKREAEMKVRKPWGHGSCPGPALSPSQPGARGTWGVAGDNAWSRREGAPPALYHAVDT